MNLRRKERSIESTTAGGDSVSSRSFLQCSLCGESYRIDYHGRRPPFCPQLVFMEDVFCMRDPFAFGGGDGGENRKCLPTVVGGTCSVCDKNVCTQCSLFYSVRLCGKCARQNRRSCPQELQHIVDATASGSSPPTDAIPRPSREMAPNVLEPSQIAYQGGRDEKR